MNNDLIFMETSAKTGHNVKEIFSAIATRIPEVKPVVNKVVRDDYIILDKTEVESRGNDCCKS
ncbi:uncharacterized protein LOC144359423 [Saccoglossus kowalevskii]